MMDNQEQNASNDPAIRSEQNAKSKLPIDIWVLCKSKTYPGLPYYFNKATGEAMWSMDFEKLKEKRTVCDTAKRSTQFNDNYPEPRVPPSNGHYSTASPSSSHVYNKQIINNKFSRNAYPWSTFGNVSFSNYLSHPVSNHYAYSFPEVPFNHTGWAIPANPPVFIGPPISIPNENQSFNDFHNEDEQKIAVQRTSISLSDRFKSLSSSIEVSRKIEIPRLDKNNPRFGKNFRYKPENSTNVIDENSSTKLHYNDLRLMLVAKRRKSIDTPEMENDNEESDREYNNCEDDSERNQENITMKMTGLQVSSPVSPEHSPSSFPTRKKITFDSLHVGDLKNNTWEDEINIENTYEDDMDLRETLKQIDVTCLKKLSKPNDRNDLWFIVVDTCVLLSNLFFVNMLVKSDNKCCMMIPYRVHDELESQCRDMSRNHTLRIVQMAQRARRYIAEELSVRTCVVAQSAVEAEDRHINCPKEDDDILNCCLQLTSQNYHVILLTNDENLITKSSICGIHSFTVKSIKKYLSGKETEKTFLPGPLKITIENKKTKDTAIKHQNFLVSNTRLSAKSNIYESDTSKNFTVQRNFGSVTLPQKQDNHKHVPTDKFRCIDMKSVSTSVCNKTQDVECQTGEAIENNVAKESCSFLEKKYLNLDSVHKSYNSVCLINPGSEHQDEKANSIKNSLQHGTNTSFQQTNKELCTEKFAYARVGVTTKTNNNNNNVGNTINVQRNKKRDIHLKRSNNNTLNDATTTSTKKRPFKWRRNNISLNKNISDECNNITVELNNPKAKSDTKALLQVKYPSQDMNIDKFFEQSVPSSLISNDNSIFDGSLQQSKNGARVERGFNNLEESTASVSPDIPQKVISYASEASDATGVHEITFSKTHSSGLNERNDMGKVVNKKVKYGIDRKRYDITKEQHMFNIKDKVIEEKFKMGCDEWLSRYVQIMEEVLTQILQQHPSELENRLLSPPWTLHEAAECIKLKYESHPSIKCLANQLSLLLFTISDKTVTKLLSKLKYESHPSIKPLANQSSLVLFTISDETGKISSNLSAEQFMKLFNYGMTLIGALSDIHVDCEDITVAKASLCKVLNDIQDPNSHGFDTEVTTGLQDMLNENTSNHNSGNDVDQIDPTCSSIISNNVPDAGEKQNKSLEKVKNSDQELWKTTFDVQTLFNKITNNKDTSDSVFDSNCTPLQNVTGNITSKEFRDIDKLKNLKRTINVQDKSNAINSTPPENLAPIEKTQVEVASVQPKIIRNFTGIPDFEKRLNGKRKAGFHLDSSDYSKYAGLRYELEDQDEYLDEEYDNQFSDGSVTDENDSLYDISKNLSAQAEPSQQGDTQTNHKHKVDAVVFKRPVDVHKDNEKIKGQGNMEFVIKTFLREIKETFLQVHTYCQEVLKEMKRASTITSLRKQEIYQQTENTHSHLKNITRYLKTILQRDTDDVDKTVQSFVQGDNLKNLCLDGEQSLVYRTVIAKCLDQASVLSEILTDIISTSHH